MRKISPWLSSPITNIVIGGIGVLTGVLLARTLGPTDRGILAGVMLWPSLVLLLGGIVNTQGIVYFWSKTRFPGRHLPQDVLGSSLLLAGCLTLMLVPIGLGVNFFALGASGKEGYRVANIFLLSIPLSLFATCFMSPFLAEERYYIFWGLRGGQSLLYLIGLLLLNLYNRLDVLSVILVVLASMLGQLLASIALFFKQFRLRPALDLDLATSLAHYGTRTNLAGLPYHLNVRLDQLLMSLLLSPQVLGHYVVAYAWSSMLSFLGGGVSMVMLPHSASLDNADPSSTSGLARKFRRVLILLTMVGVAAAIAAPTGITMLFGTEFAPSIVPAMILCIAGIALNNNLVLHEMARGLGHPAIGIWTEGVGLVLTVLLLAILLPLLGGVGAALASLVSYSVAFMSLAYLVSRRVGFPVGDLILPRASDIRELRDWFSRLMHHSLPD